MPRSTCSTTPARSTSAAIPPSPCPAAWSDGLPIGMMLVGRHFDEATVIRAAAAFEATGDWKKR